MKSKWRLVFRIIVASLYLAVGWIVGLVILFIATVRGLAWLVRMRRALAPTIACPWCRARVPQYGPYRCGQCGRRTLGWVWRCRCGAWAGHTECPACGMSVSNPGFGAP